MLLSAVVKLNALGGGFVGQTLGNARKLLRVQHIAVGQGELGEEGDIWVEI
jgi:hypothetical protein